MKTCKKIFAGVLVLAMMLSMCAFTVSADEATETLATSVLYSFHSFEGETVGTTKTTGAYAQDSGMIGSAAGGLNLRGAGNGGNSAAVTVKEDSTGNQYISSLHSSLGYNHRQTTNEISALVDLTAYPVICASWDIMIPAEDAYKTNARTMTVAMGANALDVNANISSAKVLIKEGVITGSEAKSTVKCSNPVDYTYGSWINVRVLGWITDAGNMQIAIYVDNDLIYVGVSESTNTVGLATNAYDFRYVATDADSNAITSETCYDNIKMEFLPATAKLSDAEIDAIVAEQKARTPYIRLLEYTGDTLDSGYVKDGVGTSGKDVFDSTGPMKYSLVQAGATDDHAAAAYTVVEETDRTYTNVTTSSFRYLLANVRDSFADYVQKGNGDMGTFVYSNDLNLKDLNASVKGQFAFGLDLSSVDTVDPTNPTGDKILARKTNDVVVAYTISTDGKISFDGGVTAYGSIKTGALRSESRDVTVGDWINVKMVFEITHGETEYVIKAYGIYEDDVIYENEFGLTYTDYDKDKVADDIHIGMVYLQLGTDNKTHTETVTGVDNFYFDKNDNFDWSAINTDAWINRRVEISKDASGNVDVYARDTESFQSGTLVIAICNSNGLVKEIITSTAIEDGAFSYKVPAEKVVAGNIIKGFVFDTLTSSKPQMPKGTYIVK